MFYLFCRYRLRILMLGSAFFGMALVAAPVAHATTITVVNNDGAGEGFNDPTPVAPVGGNTGTTLGDQRLIAFQHAADIWGGLITSPVVIQVDAKFDPLSCSTNSAILGSAGPKTVHRDFAGAPVSNTWFAQAQANSLFGGDLNPGQNDINATFSSTIGTPGCLQSSGWYYGLDSNPTGSLIDFVSVLLHELGHGLGFLSLVSLSTGAKLSGFDDAYMLHLEDHTTGKSYPQMTDAERLAANVATGNLHWTGTNVIAGAGGLTAGRHPSGHVQMYAPNPAQPGSSVSHWDTALLPNELMEPFYTGPLHDVGLALELFADLGWNIGPTLPEVTIAAIDNTATEQGPTTGMFTVTRTGSTASPLTVNYTVGGSATPGSDYFALSGNVVILTGQSSAQIVVTPIDDAASEGDETVIATLTANAAYVIGAQSSATVTITDDDAPDTIINSGPAALTNSTTAIFNFTSTDPSATFACSRDGSPFAGCTSPLTLTNLKIGAHNFKVQATVSGVTDPSPANFDWTIDKKAPNTAITTGPVNPTNINVATFTFTSTEAGGGFQCSLDGSPFAPCTSPFTSSLLADGKHTFRVKAVDDAGNIDKSAAKVKTWTVDTMPPDTTITKTPPSSTTSTGATFRFKSNEKSTFQCSLDNGPFETCKSGKTYPGLVAAAHNFRVQATDLAGNIDPNPANFDWTIIP